MVTFTVFKGQENGIPKKSTTTKPDHLTGDNVFVKVIASGVCGTGMCLQSNYATDGKQPLTASPRSPLRS